MELGSRRGWTVGGLQNTVVISMYGHGCRGQHKYIPCNDGESEPTDIEPVQMAIFGNVSRKGDRRRDRDDVTTGKIPA